MTDQHHCASCGHKLRLAWRPPLVTVGEYTYHSICWVMKEAPSVKAQAAVN